MAHNIGNVWEVEAWDEGVWAAGVWAGNNPPDAGGATRFVYPLAVAPAVVAAIVVQPPRVRPGTGT